jgi:hypothetical protein
MRYIYDDELTSAGQASFIKSVSWVALCICRMPIPAWDDHQRWPNLHLRNIIRDEVQRQNAFQIR